MTTDPNTLKARIQRVLVAQSCINFTSALGTGQKCETLPSEQSVYRPGSEEDTSPNTSHKCRYFSPVAR
jgi:hypothetical protein